MRVNTLCLALVVPAWLAGVCVPLASLKTPSGLRRRPERISLVPLVSLEDLSALVPGSSVWGLDKKSGRTGVSDAVK